MPIAFKLECSTSLARARRMESEATHGRAIAERLARKTRTPVSSKCHPSGNAPTCSLLLRTIQMLPRAPRMHTSFKCSRVLHECTRHSNAPTCSTNAHVIQMLPRAPRMHMSFKYSHVLHECTCPSNAPTCSTNAHVIQMLPRAQRMHTSFKCSHVPNECTCHSNAPTCSLRCSVRGFAPPNASLRACAAQCELYHIYIYIYI
jgi:hypothetical protein